MKLKILFLLFFASLSSFAQYTAIPDVNFEKKLIALGHDSGTADGKVLTAKISSLTSLNVISCSITDLTGIQDFASLTTLYCGFNSITNLDVSKNLALVTLDAFSNLIKALDVSKNIKLQVLDLSSNKFTLLDISSNVALTKLCVNDNELTSLDISKNLALITLNCTTNKMPTLNVSKNLYLTKLGCDSNLLSTLDVSKNIALEDLFCSFNKLTTLDISKNVALININCGNNQLTTLDISKNPEIYYLACSGNKMINLDVAKNLKLGFLSCENNQLTSLNVSKNISLKDLYCEENKITTLDVSNNLQLQDLFCNVNQLTSLNVSKNTALEELEFHNNKITNLDVSNNVNLIKLNCVDNLISILDVSKNTNLTKLLCSNNTITHLDVSKNIDLYRLSCDRNQIETLDLSKNVKLYSLDCSTNQLVNLNIKNGNNTELSYPDIRNNPNLFCILVDDAAYSTANWIYNTDNQAFFTSTACVILSLPSNNFEIETKSESCLDEGNGEISIKANALYNYKANLDGKYYTFTNNHVIADLTPGTYNLAITIPGQNFIQRFTITIARGTTIAGKTSKIANKLNVSITKGTAPYTVFMDGVEQFETSDSNFSIETQKGGLLEVKTSKFCEGIYSENLEITGKMISSYPNPTSNNFEIEFATTQKEIAIALYTADGHLISNKTYEIKNGKVQLSLENQASGVYFVKTQLPTNECLKIIKN